MLGMYPISVDLVGRRCLVVGGGKVGLRKVETLLQCGAVIDLISPGVVSELKELADQGKINWKCHDFDGSDLRGYMMVFACTDNESTNQMVFEMCKEANILVNTVDDPQKCNFFVPATVRRGALTIAISTEGNSPLLARRIREQLERQYGNEYVDYLEILGEARVLVKKMIPDEDLRRELFHRILAVDVIPLLEQGRKTEAKERVLQCIYSWPD
ncbi:MAG: bifunctional precorrin-2 dehydrogenase/sirohydrochlorin ferrochelatase [Syntrophomonadaceae bacterium]|nr:bifunctional precorrin-2 dehydrogenase/sirohydrochlorin ferrochelatase [Syntrophomonadaceae bacterium]